MFEPKSHYFKKPLTCLFATTFIFSVMACNNESNKASVTSEQAGLPAESTQIADTSKVVSTEPGSGVATSATPPTPIGKDKTPATPIVEDKTPAIPIVKDDNAQFRKVLSYDNFSFIVTAKGKGSLQQLSLKPSGLSGGNGPIVLEVEPVVGAEIEDFNLDGYPEVLIFTQSAGSGSYGKVLAYSVNKGKSMSRVTFPATNDNQRISTGYRGHDRFKVVNKQLVQTFPIFENGDANTMRTGKNRRVTYKLKDGEASRIFVVDNVME